MQITNFRVSFKRQVQPASYESAAAEVEYTGVIDEGEDVSARVAEVLSLAKRQALAAVGKGPKVEEQSACQVTNASPTSNSSTPTAEPSSGEAPAQKKGRGSSKSKAKDETAPSVEQTKATSEAPFDAPFEQPAEEPEEISDAALQEAANAAARKHTGRPVKAIMAEQFKVSMLRDIKPGDRARFLAALRALDKD